MLKTRVIPTMLWKDFGLVKGVAFDSWRRTGSILQAVKVYNMRDVDELILLDIAASRTGEAIDLLTLSDLADACFVPLTVGGGITCINDVAMVLRAGADKVCINSASYTQTQLVSEVARAFGSQCVVASIDARRNPDGSYETYSHSGSAATGREPAEWAKVLQDRGAGEILVTSIERDGTMTGYDLELVSRVSEAVTLPVIASGGAGTTDHMVSAVKEAGASAVAAASIFHFTQLTPTDVKAALAQAKIPVRRSLELPSV